MKTLNILILSTVLTASLGTASRANNIVIDSSQPAGGPDDIVNVSTPTAINGVSDYTLSYPVAGQTFTTPGTAVDLTSITFQAADGGNGYESASNNYALTIFSIGAGGVNTGTALTYIGGETDFTFNGTAVSSGQFYTLDLTTPLVLAANTEYAATFNVYGGGGYLGFDGNDSGSTYAGGTSFNANFNNYFDITQGAVISSSNGYDRNFEVGLSETPEPSTWAMMFGGVAMLFGMTRFGRRTL